MPPKRWCWAFALAIVVCMLVLVPAFQATAHTHDYTVPQASYTHSSPLEVAVRINVFGLQASNRVSLQYAKHTAHRQQYRRVWIDPGICERFTAFYSMRSVLIDPRPNMMILPCHDARYPGPRAYHRRE
jgi:hypothetical protein